MPIPLPATTTTTIEALTPRQIVAELDKYVVGQAQAKRAVAIALRNRTRRQKLPPELAEEIAPKNILMIGPTGVGKTEIARRLARLAQSPFLKVEASKFTEVGYVGRDVESMVRDLVEIAVDMVRDERRAEVREKARQAAEERVLDLLLPPLPAAAEYDENAASIREQAQRTREKLREQLRDGRLDHKHVEIDVREKSFPSFEIIAGSSVEEVDINVKDMLPGFFRRQDPQAPAPRPGGARARSRRKKSRSSSTWRASPAPRSSACSRPASSSSTRSTRSPDARGARARRQPRRRPARHPADRRGHDRQHEVRDGEDRPHPVHRRGRLPRVEAVGPDPGAAGALPDPRRARAARPRRLRAHPDRAEERAHQAVHGAALHRRRRRCGSPTARSTGSRTSPRWSTSGPRTSARAGCTR